MNKIGTSSYGYNFNIGPKVNIIKSLHYSIPKSYFSIDESCNNFLLDDTLLVIPDGNYNISELIAKLNIVVNDP